MSTVITIIIAAVLTNNFVLSKFYGCCPFLGVSKKLDSSIGMPLCQHTGGCPSGNGNRI